MDFKSSAINISEREVLRELPATVDVAKTGAILECNWGEALVPTPIASGGGLVNTFGEVDAYNVKNYMNVANYLRYASNLTLVRPIPADARNNSIKLIGGSTNSINNSKAVELLHNQKVAKNSLEELISVKDAELEIFHRFITTKENVAVAICSSEEHWSQPISNERIPVIRDVDMTTTPLSLVDGETYSVKAGVAGKLGKYVSAAFTIDSYDNVAKTITINTAATVLADAWVGKHIKTTNSALNGVYEIGDNTASANGKVIVTLASASMPVATIVPADKALLLETSATGDILTYNINGYSEFEKAVFVTDGMLVLVEKKGLLTTVDSGVVGKTPFNSKYNYLPVDENKDGVAEYAVKQIYKSYLYNSNKTLKAFKSVVNYTPDFLNGDFVVLVFLKDEKDGKFDLVEKHLVSYDPKAKLSTGKTKFAEEVIFSESKYIYLKVGSYAYSVTSVSAGEKKIVFPTTSFFTAAYSSKTVALSNGTDEKVCDIVSVNLADKTIVVKELTALTGTITAVFDKGFGKVNTNPSASFPLDVKGFPVEDLVLKETDDAYKGFSYSMSNTWGATAKNIITENDFNTAADIFADKDNVDVQMLISFATKDNNNILHQDKMANIARTRENCLAINGLLDAKDVIGKPNSFISKYIVDNFGTKREDKYNGLFTEFSSFTSCYNNMVKQYVPALDKTTYVSQLGEIAGLLTRLINNKGLGTALAGVIDGVIQSSKNLLWDPSREDKDLMSKNNINTICWSKVANAPIINEQVTSTTDDNSNFRDQDIRVTMNAVKDFLSEALVVQLWKKNTPSEREATVYRIKPFFDQLYLKGVLAVPAIIVCDSSNNDADAIKNNTLKISISLVFSKSIRTIDVDITSYDYGTLEVSETER